MKILLLSTSLLILCCIVIFTPFKDSRNDFLKEELTELETYIVHRDSRHLEVSKVDVAWHLDHSLRTINEIYKAMHNSDPATYRSSIHLGRFFLLLINQIPRGRAEAPEIVKPPEMIHTDSLYAQLSSANRNRVRLDSLPRKAYFEHPYLGSLKKKTAKRFLEIHTEHHLKIIRDILKR